MAVLLRVVLMTLALRANGVLYKNPAHISVAKKEALELEAFITGKRLAKKNELVASASGRRPSALSSNENEHSAKFHWESEIDTEWADPYIDPKLWQDMPEFQTYSRNTWFGKYNDTQLQELRTKGENMTFAFALSTGHSGTTTLSLAESYQGFNSSHCEFGFEFLAQGTRDFVRRHPGRGAARAFVRRYFLPSIIERTLAARKTCFVDIGHHTLFGHFMSALKLELGPRMKAVRLRRARLDTANSYTMKRKKDGPCGTRCFYCLCPDEQRSCLHVKADLWRRLTVFMRFLWMVDEVECRWHAFLADSNPVSLAASGSTSPWVPRLTSSEAVFNTKHARRESNRLAKLQVLQYSDVLEVSWSADLGPEVERFAVSMGFEKLQHAPKKELEVHKSHVAKRQMVLRSPDQNSAEDKLYRRLMEFTPEQMEMLAPVFF
jgi:hypothetical protein